MELHHWKLMSFMWWLMFFTFFCLFLNRNPSGFLLSSYFIQWKIYPCWRWHCYLYLQLQLKFLSTDPEIFFLFKEYSKIKNFNEWQLKLISIHHIVKLHCFEKIQWKIFCLFPFSYRHVYGSGLIIFRWIYSVLWVLELYFRLFSL